MKWQKKWQKNSKLKILNMVSGSKFGGAELFFERLALSFEKQKNIKQKLVIKTDERRFNFLKDKINDIKQINFLKVITF